jgi:hypothetical protein
MWPSRCISTAVAVTMPVHPESRSFPVEISEPDASDGKMCAWHASGNSDGRLSVAVWVLVRRPPLGTRTEMLGFAILSVNGMSSQQMKCPVAPESKMALEVNLGIGEERATREIVGCAVRLVFILGGTVLHSVAVPVA